MYSLQISTNTTPKMSTFKNMNEPCTKTLSKNSKLAFKEVTLRSYYYKHLIDIQNT